MHGIASVLNSALGEPTSGTRHWILGLSPNGVTKVFGQTEISLQQVRPSPAAFARIKQAHGRRNAHANFHQPALGRHRKTLHQDPIWTAARDENRVAPFANGDLLIGLAHLTFPGEGCFALLTIDPEREPR